MKKKKTANGSEKVVSKTEYWFLGKHTQAAQSAFSKLGLFCITLIPPLLLMLPCNAELEIDSKIFMEYKSNYLQCNKGSVSLTFGNVSNLRQVAYMHGLCELC